MWLLTFTIAKYGKIIKNVGNTGKMESVFSRDYAPGAFFHSRETGIKIFAPGNSREFPGNSKFTYCVPKLWYHLS